MAKTLPNDALPSDIFDDSENEESTHEQEPDEIRQHKKDEVSTKHSSKDTTIDAPSFHDIRVRSQRDQEQKTSSAFLRIVLIVFVVIIVLITAGTSFYFFNSRTAPQPDFQNTEESDALTEETSTDVYDTTNWQQYVNDAAGLRFKYPEEFVLERYDQILGAPNASGTPQLILRSSDGLQTLNIWIDTQGITQFINPNAVIVGNPLNAGIHYILTVVDDTMEVKSERYFSTRSGVVQSDVDTITAYAPEQPGVYQYTMLYSDTREGNISEGFMKAFIDTIKLRLDADSDGLYADEEEALGTDPLLADTDGDGFTDLEEVEHGYNPLGEGYLGSE